MSLNLAALQNTEVTEIPENTHGHKATWVLPVIEELYQWNVNHDSSIACGDSVIEEQYSRIGCHDSTIDKPTATMNCHDSVIE